jgi:hypothetical protein
MTKPRELSAVSEFTSEIRNEFRSLKLAVIRALILACLCHTVLLVGALYLLLKYLR